jgi:hypothetical protein
MEKRTTNIIIIVALVLICACLPLCLGLIGGINWMFSEDIIRLHGNSGYYGFGGICLGFLGFLVAGVVAFLLLRKKPEDGLSPEEPEEPLPPSI